MESICIRKILGATLLLLLMSGCNAQPTFKIGDCLIPKNENSPEKIMRIVSSSPTEYKVFTSFLSGGRLIQAKDYQSLETNKAASSYVKVECPKFEGDFSPDAYLNKKQ